MLKEFKDFIMRGNVVDLAVAVVIGAAFGAIVTSMVNDLIMPIVGAITGGVDFTNYFTPLSVEGHRDDARRSEEAGRRPRLGQLPADCWSTSSSSPPCCFSSSRR